MRVRRSSIRSLWLLEVWSHSPATTLSSESLIKTSSRTIVLSFSTIFFPSCKQKLFLQQQLRAGRCPHIHHQWLHLSVLGNRYLLYHRLQGHGELWQLHGRVSSRVKDHVRCDDRQHLADLTVLLFWQQHLKSDKFLQLPRRQRHTKQLRRCPFQHK